MVVATYPIAGRFQTQQYVGLAPFLVYSETVAAPTAQVAVTQQGKQFMTHVYDSSGNYLATWRDVSNLPSFTWRLNSGPGASQDLLPRAWGNAGEVGDYGGPAGTNGVSVGDLALDNLVKRYVVDLESGPSGQLIYQGYIDAYQFDLGRESTAVTYAPLTTLQADQWIEGPVTLQGDPTNMLYYFLNTTVPGLTSTYIPGLTWDATNPLVGATYTQTFQNQKLGQVMETIRSLAGGTWFWRINPDNTLTFNHWDLSAVANHTLIVGRHCSSSITLVKSRTPKKQRVEVYGAAPVAATATTAATALIFAYAQSPDFSPARPRTMVYSNNRITDYGTAQRIANAFLEFYNRDFYSTTIEVTDSNFAPVGGGWDIESLKVGQTVALVFPDTVFRLPRWGDGGVWGDGGYWGGPPTAAFQTPFVISQIDYAGTSSRIYLQQAPLATPNELVNLNDRLILEQTQVTGTVLPATIVV